VTTKLNACHSPQLAQIAGLDASDSSRCVLRNSAFLHCSMLGGAAVHLAGYADVTLRQARIVTGSSGSPLFPSTGETAMLQPISAPYC